MDVAKLKRLYGKELSFWGSIDVQHTLPCGKPGDVVDEVKSRLRDVGKGGGFILSTAHCIQPDTSLENIFAYYDAAKKYGKYPINI